jgi:hypothetical protein
MRIQQCLAMMTIAAIGMTAPVFSARGQGVTQATATAETRGCLTFPAASVTGSVSAYADASCGLGVVGSRTWAEVANGRLRTEAAVSILPGPDASDVWSRATARWVETLRITSLTIPTTVDIEATFRGFLGVYCPIGDYSCHAEANIYAYVGGAPGSINSGKMTQPLNESQKVYRDANGAVPKIDAPVNQMHVFKAAIESVGSGGYGAMYEVFMASYARAFVPPDWTNTGGVGAYAQSAFNHTAYISALVFYDANGVDISDQITYTFDGGTLLGDPDAITATPEPASMTLIGSGFAAIAGWRSRRRKRATA